MRAASSSLGAAEVVEELIGRRLLQWIQLRPVEVLQQSVAQEGVVVGFADDRRDAAEPGGLSGRSRRSPMTSS